MLLHYRIVEKVGAGGMGDVYLAEDTKLGREVALKVLPDDFAGDAKRLSRFGREARILAALDHPNIVTVFSVDEADGVHFLTMAFIEGQTLGELIPPDGLSLDRFLSLSAPLADALRAAHEKDIVHRDLKPSNVMLDKEDRLRVLDFGLAKLEQQAVALEGIPQATKTMTQAGVVLGTFPYMSPEQLEGKTADERSDIFSLGVVLYEMATGEPPFHGDTPAALISSILKDSPTEVTEVRPELPGALGKLIVKCLEKNPERRYQTAQEVHDALEALKAAVESGEMRAARRSSRLVRFGVGALVVVSLFVIAAILGWWWSRPSLAFGERDKLLVADVDNQTGEEAFELALGTALEADLRQSPFASVFERSEITETLKLMRRDPSTHVDEELGRDLCRFAGVKALLLPRILSAGNAYELQAILVDPVNGRHVESIRVTARSKEEVLLEAIDELTREVRRTLGESFESIQEADYPVAKVTTSSWEALRSLSLGQQRWNEGRFDEAAAMFELALEQDPHFATASASLGLVLLQFLDEPERGKQMLRQALADAEGLPEREHLLVRAVNRQFADEDLEGALDEYRLIADLYPDLWQPHNNSGRILMSLGRYEEAAAMFERAAELNPKSGIPLFNLWYIHTIFRRDLYSGEDAARRVVKLGPEVATYQNLLGWTMVCQGRFEEAIPPLRVAVKLDPHHAYAVPNLAHMLLRTGAAEEAVPIYASLLDDIRSGLLPGKPLIAVRNLAIAERAAGRTDRARQLAVEEIERLAEEPALLTATPQLLLQLAQLEFLAGETRRAEDHVEQALVNLVPEDPHTVLSLAEAYALGGRHDDAFEAVVQTLEAGYQDVFFLRVLPSLSPLWDDPQFEALFVAAARPPGES
jgi:Flp pilus assembly protein TadD